SQSPDMKTRPEGPVRAPSAVPIDDAVLPYEVDALDVRGRLVRLGPALDEILTKHDYPAPVGKLLGEAIVLTTRLGDAKDSGALLGHGHLAMTIDQGPDMSRYQGLVALDGGSLEDAAHEYFL